MLRLSEVINKDNEYTGEIPCIIYSNISIIIPVKNNQCGIDRFLKEFYLTHNESKYPCEIVIIDNNSDIPLVIDEKFKNNGLNIRLLSCKKPGPAAARNIGVSNSKGEWLLFCDSDCIPTTTLLDGYIKCKRKAIAYTGNVKSISNSWLSTFYDSEDILLPHMKKNVNNEFVPLYIVTANALIWKETLITCGLFNEIFNNAGGEDVELAIRLWQIGNIYHVDESIILHDFDDGLNGFYKRFIRYGVGNMQLEKVQAITMKPKFRSPKKVTFTNYIAKILQHSFMTVGYLKEKRRIKKAC